MRGRVEKGRMESHARDRVNTKTNTLDTTSCAWEWSGVFVINKK
jgi:hypothetical protein